VDASSVIDILTLGCSKGSEITLLVENIEDNEIFNKISDYIERGAEEL
jgi:phosphotransferase system HPr-like phosphotransfer protein